MKNEKTLLLWKKTKERLAQLRVERRALIVAFLKQHEEKKKEQIWKKISSV